MPYRARVIVVEERAELARRAAEEVERLAGASIAARGTFHVALAGGSTPRELYERLAREPGLDRERWHAWFGDERCVAPADERSNFRMARLTLLEPGGIPRERWHPMFAAGDEPEAAARAYEDELRRALGPEPRLDLALLGMGADGHTASLFPESAALDACERRVVAVPAWRGRDVARLTLTIGMLSSARALLFLVAGEEKRATLRAVLAGEAGARALPAALVCAAHADPLWIVDRAAAGSWSGD
jgi:6-phosphogluconolactonase